MPRRRDKPRHVLETLAVLSGGPRFAVSFRGGPLAGVVLDSQSAHEAERWDVAWIFVKTHGGQLGGRFRGWDRLRSQGGHAGAGEYEVQSQAGDATERRLVLVYNAGPGPPAGRPRE